MIVLDEQLLGRGIEHDIARWYRGKVQFITDLRPNTVIKDEIIPALLRQQSQPTFVTINDRDFWQRAPGSARYCMVCFAWPDRGLVTYPSLYEHCFAVRNLELKVVAWGRSFG